MTSAAGCKHVFLGMTVPSLDRREEMMRAVLLTPVFTAVRATATQSQRVRVDRRAGVARVVVFTLGAARNLRSLSRLSVSQAMPVSV
jgi:glucose uptake protein GlcU